MKKKKGEYVLIAVGITFLAIFVLSIVVGFLNIFLA